MLASPLQRSCDPLMWKKVRGQSCKPWPLTVVPSAVGFKYKKPILNDQQLQLTYLSFTPGLDEIIVIDGLALWFFISKFRFWRTRLIQPVGLIALIVHFRPHVSLGLAARNANENLVLFARKVIHRLINGHFSGNGFTDVLPPELRQFRIVRNVRAGRSPGHTCRAAVEFNQATQLRRPLGEGLIADVAVSNRRQSDVGFFQRNRFGNAELGK